MTIGSTHLTGSAPYCLGILSLRNSKALSMCLSAQPKCPPNHPEPSTILYPYTCHSSGRLEPVLCQVISKWCGTLIRRASERLVGLRVDLGHRLVESQRIRQPEVRFCTSLTDSGISGIGNSLRA